MPGLEHLPFAEVWFHEVDDELWREASTAARAIGKTGLEVWTTDKTPQVVAFFEERGYEQVRHYVISELDVTAAPDPEPPAFRLVTFADRPDLAPALFEIARESYPDQPGRPEQRLESLDEWRAWGLDPHPPDAYFVALEDERVLGYGFLDVPRRRVVERLHGDRARRARPRRRRRDQARPDRVGEEARRARVAHRERGAARRHARVQQAARLPDALHRDRPARSGRVAVRPRRGAARARRGSDRARARPR